jgi:predicted AlkP superfamily phosphohydrolase/phosphomutase
VRAAVIFLKNRRVRKGRKIRRAIVVGLDGFDPHLSQVFMGEGKLPHFQNLKEYGSFRELRTTTPAISPAAWSTFSTGVNPGKHRIFDFFTRNAKNYSPVLSSVDISFFRKVLKIFSLEIPLWKTKVKFLRKSTSFWKILGQNGIFSSIIRVPVTFPPEKFYGSGLSAMCTPDLLGTQGTFTQYTSEDATCPQKYKGGKSISIQIREGKFKSHIPGPAVQENESERYLSSPIEGQVDYEQRTVHLKIGKEVLRLREGHYSSWIRLEFKVGLWKRIRGIARFLVTEMEPRLKIYMTPINIDPEKPTLPISHPFFYSIILSKLHGSFASLGLAEDTWALNERVIDEGAFLKQAYDIYEERKKHLKDALRKNKEGLVVSVFDTTDRIQHMFFRYLSPDHPANKDKDTTIYKDAIPQLYQRMDSLLGEIHQELRENDLLIIISDHGFRQFKWGINMNTWLWKQGYLTLKKGATPGKEWFGDVDWSKTRAYAYGLSGIFVNIHGREPHGIVRFGGERLALQEEIKHKLESLRDERNELKPVRRAILAQEVLKGPFREEAPDLFIGYAEGYRVSWNSAIGKITENVVEDNTRSWSGDHTIDPDLVPGVFFSNWKLKDLEPYIGDIGPTILNLFGLDRCGFHDGKILKLIKPNGKKTM